MTDLCEVVITAPDADWLASFVRDLVDDRLVAGAHQIERIRAIYRWEGRVHDKPESRVALHTRVDLVSAIVDRANADHPYEVPCVITLPITAGNPDYLRWVEQQTADRLPHAGHLTAE